MYLLLCGKLLLCSCYRFVLAIRNLIYNWVCLKLSIQPCLFLSTAGELYVEVSKDTMRNYA